MLLSGFQQDSVTEYLKSLCTVFEIHNEVCIFEELICRFHLQKQDLSNPERWKQKCEFLKEQKNYFTNQLPTISEVYDRFLLPVIRSFSENNYLTAFKEYTKSLNLEQAVRTFLEQKEAVLRHETATAYNIILTAIKNIDVLIGSEKITMQDYYTGCSGSSWYADCRGYQVYLYRNRRSRTNQACAAYWRCHEQHR